MSKRYWETRDATTGILLRKYTRRATIAEELGITTSELSYAILMQKPVNGKYLVTAIDPADTAPKAVPSRMVNTNIPIICRSCVWVMHKENTAVCPFRRCVKGYGWAMEKEAAR